MPLSPEGSGYAKVLKTEEKGSDVNLATHLLMDGFRDDYELQEEHREKTITSMTGGVTGTSRQGAGIGAQTALVSLPQRTRLR
jgi:hypothetical protein